jgi:hypothetical protein
MADPTGQTWLPNLLRRATENTDYAEALARRPGTLFPLLLATRPYHDDCWGRQVDLEECFESPKTPSERLLLWVVNHPNALNGPIPGPADAGETAEWRRSLLGVGPHPIDDAQMEARRRLTECGANGSMGWWWAFEGKTVVDCYLETDRLILLFEGKRNEPISTRTEWMRVRNQVWRNLDVAANQATGSGKRYAVMLLGETCEPVYGFDESLPHLSADERQFLRGHFLGCVKWQDACAATGIDFGTLPDNIGEAQP